MKYKVLILIILLLTIVNVNAKKMEVTFASCTDGDTASFNYNGETIKVRFLAIDTPETVHPTIEEEPYGKEASEYTCNAITNASSIILETDLNSDEQDSYSRYLAWVWVDGELLQKNLVTEGLAEVAYLYGDYLYTEELQEAQAIAQTNQIGIWGDYVAPIDYTIYYAIGGVVLLIILALIIPKMGNKTARKYAYKGKSKAKSYVKKGIKSLLK